MTYNPAVKFIVESTSAVKGVEYVDKDVRVCNRPYNYGIAEGDVTGHTPWSKIGYNPAITTAEEDIWSAGGAYAFAAAAGVWEFVSSDNTDDIGTVLHSGTNTTGGSTTTLEETGENFLTTTVAGDLVIVDAGGTTPEWGWITAVDTDEKITFRGHINHTGRD